MRNNSEQRHLRGSRWSSSQFGGDNRRDFVRALAGAAGGAVLWSSTERLSSVLAQTPSMSKASLIDVHQHFVPRFYYSENRERIAAAANGWLHPGYANWTVEEATATMEKQGVATAVLSLTTPGVWFGDRRAAARTARRVNEYAAELVRSHPGRFGFFAVIPLPDAEQSLREIEYVFSVLKADGIGIMTSYDDRWLGHPVYEPVFEELNRRKAIVLVHPTVGLCCRALLPDLNPIMLEIPQDTTRAVTNLLFSGSFTRFRDIRFIFSHGGGFVPMAVVRMHQYASKSQASNAPQGIEYELKRLHYDIAGTAYRPAVAALKELVPTTQILFGSDAPFIPLAETAKGLTDLGLSAEDLNRIGRDNALGLLPQLKNEKGSMA